MTDPRKIFCAGEWTETGDTMNIVNPHSGEVAATVCRAGETEVEQATAAAVQAFEEIRHMPSYSREKMLLAIAQGIEDRAEEFSRTITTENGKPITQSRVETARAALVFRMAAEETKRIGGEIVPMDTAPGSEARTGMVRRFPLGPIYGITPFNFPLNLACHKLAPGLAAGNTVVLKPASATPLSCLMLAEVCEAAGVPRGALSVLPCSVPLAERMAGDERFKLITFTGSPAVGWALKGKAGRKRVALELGGNAGCIVHRDADADYAAARCAVAGFAFSGQVCISLQRILVHEEIFEQFKQAFVQRVEKIRLGDPADDATELGPMINEKEAERAEEWIQEAVSQGAEVLCGGARDGAFLKPTVLAATTSEMRVNCAEIFAPVVTLTRFSDIGEAIRIVDDSEFGLQAGLFTFDSRVIYRAYRELEVGGLMINEAPTFRLDHMPYGGVKMSGLGREGLKYAIEEMTEGKLLVYNNIEP